jgi:hypothetical protein
LATAKPSIAFSREIFNIGTSSAARLTNQRSPLAKNQGGLAYKKVR